MMNEKKRIRPDNPCQKFLDLTAQLYPCPLGGVSDTNRPGYSSMITLTREVFTTQQYFSERDIIFGLTHS